MKRLIAQVLLLTSFHVPLASPDAFAGFWRVDGCATSVEFIIIFSVFLVILRSSSTWKERRSGTVHTMSKRRARKKLSRKAFVCRHGRYHIPLTRIILHICGVMCPSGMPRRYVLCGIRHRWSNTFKLSQGLSCARVRGIPAKPAKEEE